MTKGTRVTAVVWCEKRRGTVLKNNGTGVVWVIWDGKVEATWMHAESLTADEPITMSRLMQANIPSK